VTFTIGTSHSGVLRSRLTQKHTYIYIIYIHTSFEQEREEERRKTTTSGPQMINYITENTNSKYITLLILVY